MDVDAYVAAHRGEWDRLDQLVRRAGRGRGSLDGAEVDELVTLYQRVNTHLSAVRSSTPDPALLGAAVHAGRRGRGRWSPARSDPPGRTLARFFVVSYPAALYRSMRWWVAVGVAFTVVGLIVGAWVAGNTEVQATIAAPEQIRQLVEHDFEDYYSSGAGRLVRRAGLRPTTPGWRPWRWPWASSCCPWCGSSGRTRSTSASPPG